jgi:hypothetical protein
MRTYIQVHVDLVESSCVTCYDLPLGPAHEWEGRPRLSPPPVAKQISVAAFVCAPPSPSPRASKPHPPPPVGVRAWRACRLARQKKNASTRRHRAAPESCVSPRVPSRRARRRSSSPAPLADFPSHIVGWPPPSLRALSAHANPATPALSACGTCPRRSPQVAH